LGFTANDGVDWSFPLSEGSDYDDVVIDPNNSDHILVSETGCAFVHKSIDGGSTWEAYEFNDGYLFCGDQYHRRIILDPENSSIGYMTMDSQGPPKGHWGGVYKTLDQGETWFTTTLKNVPVTTIVLEPELDWLLAGALNNYEDPQAGGIYRSDDGGESWTRSGMNGIPVIELAYSSQSPYIVYAGTDYMGLYKSMDGGVTWEQKLPVELQTRMAPDIAIHPQNANQVYALLNYDVYLSMDAGESWQLFDAKETGEGRPHVLDPRSGVPAGKMVNWWGFLRNPTGFEQYAYLYRGDQRGLYRTLVPIVLNELMYLPVVSK
jgi:hypothetical protein